jgi:hypothetical protein
MEQAAPGWYTDPYDPALERAWDGSAWMNETRVPPASAAQMNVWSPPSEPPPESPPEQPGERAASRRAPATNSRTVVAVIVGAVVLLAIGFGSGYVTSASRDPRRVFYVPTAATRSTPTTGTQPADVNVPGATAPPGLDTVGLVAEQDLSMAADAATTFFQVRPGVPLTLQLMNNSQFTYDDSGGPVGAPTWVGGPAVISAAIDHLSGAPRRVVLALPGKLACYYVMVTDGEADRFGVARGAGAVAHCFAAETPGSVPQVRPETKWTLGWPPPAL